MKTFSNRIESVFIWFVIGLLHRQTNKYPFLTLIKILVGIQEAAHWASSGITGMNQKQVKAILRAVYKMVKLVKSQNHASPFLVGDVKTHWQLELAATLADIFTYNSDLASEDFYAYFMTYEETLPVPEYEILDKRYIECIHGFLADYREALYQPEHASTEEMESVEDLGYPDYDTLEERNLDKAI